MNKTILKIVYSCLLVSSIILPFSTKAIAISPSVILEPEESPPLKANNYYVRASLYNTNEHIHDKNGILVLLTLGRTPEDTYLYSSSDGNKRDIITEVNCKTGNSYLIGATINGVPIPQNKQPQMFNIFRSKQDPYNIAIYHACNHFLRRR